MNNLVLFELSITKTTLFIFNNVHNNKTLKLSKNFGFKLTKYLKKNTWGFLSYMGKRVKDITRYISLPIKSFVILKIWRTLASRIFIFLIRPWFRMKAKNGLLLVVGTSSFGWTIDSILVTLIINHALHYIPMHLSRLLLLNLFTN
ncbi:hypothetical protein CR513_39001, partial [Mucuna pruriens]